MRVVLATGNPGKVLELRAMLEPLAIEVAALSEFTRTAVAETGLTVVENPIIKARHAAPARVQRAVWGAWRPNANVPGLVAVACQGSPGIYAARHPGEHASDDHNLRK